MFINPVNSVVTSAGLPSSLTPAYRRSQPYLALNSPLLLLHMLLNHAKPKRIMLTQLVIVLLLVHSTYKTHNNVSDFRF